MTSAPVPQMVTHEWTVWAEDPGVRVSVKRNKGSITLRILRGDEETSVTTIAIYRWERLWRLAQLQGIPAEDQKACALAALDDATSTQKGNSDVK